jgi:hypothetical protein
MTKITNTEKFIFLKLFNRGGYVLDFTTPDFDAFTLDSIGVALCNKYKLSKGGSLNAYIREANEEHVIKILSDLFLYYENYYFDFKKEIDNEKEKFQLYRRCKAIYDRLKSGDETFSLLTENLKEKFSSGYISTQIELMEKSQSENPTEAIGKAKELIESCCKTILEDNNIKLDKNWDIVKLVDETTKYLKITPKDMPEDIPGYQAIRAILGNLKAIANNVAQLRNLYGSGHGKDSHYKGLEERHAKLAVGSSVTLVNFLWDSHERKQNK